ncbi:MAG: hypothetical protein ACOCWA_08990 [Bacteroidota bacterium]
MKSINYIIFLLWFPFLLSAQGIYRIKGEFSIKSKENGFSQLVMGNFYYDMNSEQIIYRNYFPEKETWVTSDTTLYHIINDEVVSTQAIPNLSKFSIFHLALTRDLKNFGIDDKSFLLKKVEEDQGMVISTYEPNSKYLKFDGRIMLSMKDNKLFGIVFFNGSGEIVKKQFFENYDVQKGLPFPGKITEITYVNGQEVYKVTSYKNIEYNAIEPDNLYHFDPGQLLP